MAYCTSAISTHWDAIKALARRANHWCKSRFWLKTKPCKSNCKNNGIATETPDQIVPIQVRRSEELAGAYSQIGRNDQIKLTGRPIRRLRSLTTSKVFRIRGESMVFLPSFGDGRHFYLAFDEGFFTEQIKSELAYIRRRWKDMGRPTMTLLITRAQWETGSKAFFGII